MLDLLLVERAGEAGRNNRLAPYSTAVIDRCSSCAGFGWLNRWHRPVRVGIDTDTVVPHTLKETLPFNQGDRPCHTCKGLGYG